MLSCILSDRFYVPEAYVQPDNLYPFVYELNSSKDKEAYDYGPFESTTNTITTFSKVTFKDSHDIYYAFARGDLAKLWDMFGDLPWDDKTVDPAMTSDITFKGKLLTWQEHEVGQQEAVALWLKRKGGIIRASPRFGKTISSIYILTKLKKKTLIITHQVDLLEQFYKSLEKFTNVTDIAQPPKRSRDATGRIVGYFQDYDNPEELDVCLLCWQTLASKQYGNERILKYKNTWGLLIIDECHRLGGLQYARIVNRLAAKHRLGLTGTVERSDGREFLLHAIIGPVVAEGRVATIDCQVHITHTNCLINYSFTDPLPYLYKRIYNDKVRMQIILDDLLLDVKNGRYICFAFHRCSTKQLNHWTESLKCLGISAEAFYGACRDREGVLQRARSGETQVLVCNSQMLTGIDVPRWNTYYSAFPSGNVVFNSVGLLSGSFYQEFSRIRTPFTYEDGQKKSAGIIRDYVDNNKFCFATYRKRYKAYKNQQFSIHVKKIIEKPEL